MRHGMVLTTPPFYSIAGMMDLMAALSTTEPTL